MSSNAHTPTVPQSSRNDDKALRKCPRVANPVPAVVAFALLNVARAFLKPRSDWIRFKIALVGLRCLNVCLAITVYLVKNQIE